MKINILTIKSEFESAKQIGFPVTRSAKNVQRDVVVVRWGNSYLTRGGEFDMVINPASNISLNCDKLEALKRLSHIVKTPTIYYKMVPKGIKAVIRPYTHTAGNEFSIINGPFEVLGGYYATQFLETDEEYRVWFCGEQTFVAQRVPLTPEDHKSFPCRSNWGYSYRFKFDSKISQQTLDAAKTIGLDAGAADILKVGKDYYFLELNSAPSVDTKTLIRFFSNGLRQLILDKFKIII